MIRRRIHLCANLFGVEEGSRAGTGRFPQPRNLVRFSRDGEHAGPLPLHVHAEFDDIGLHPVEVGYAQPLELVEFVRPACLSVVCAVGQAGVDEAAVATGGRPSQALPFDQHDVGAGVSLGGVQGRPQPGVATADHQQIAGQRYGQAWVVRAVPGHRRVKPHRPERRRRQRLGDQTVIDGSVENNAHGY